MQKVILFGFVGFVFWCIITVMSQREAEAIPAFARKYQTSCGTCHSIYPKLNAFGEAFRQNGFQFPEDELEKIKEEPVKMGSEAYKRVWPDAVWPNSIPGTAPISVRARMGFGVEKDDGETISEFGMPALQLMTAGTMGENITIFIGAHLFEDGEVGSIDRLYLKLDNMFTSFLPERALYFRIGQFIPEMVTFASNHRGLTNSAYAFNTYAPSLGSGFTAGHVHGAGPFGIERFQLGVEASGIVKSRTRYVVGLVNGNGAAEDNNSKKDLYGRLSYKLGGMAFDGSTAAVEGSAPSTASINVDQRSLTLGVFGYKGIGVDGGNDADFHRIGFDVNLNYSKLNLFGGYIFGQDFSDANSYNLFFVQGDYTFFPWLIGILRYEQANPKNLDSARQLIPHLSALYVANIKFIIESRINLDDADFDNLFIGMDFAF